jgi:hypothetical protein
MPADAKGENNPPNCAADKKGRPESRPLACDRRSYAALATSSSARRTAGRHVQKPPTITRASLSSNDNLSPRPSARLAG